MELAIPTLRDTLGLSDTLGLTRGRLPKPFEERRWRVASRAVGAAVRMVAFRIVAARIVAVHMVVEERSAPGGLKYECQSVE